MPESASNHPGAAVTAASLLADLDSAGGTVTVPNPPDPVRAAYRRAISRAVTDGLVPDGHGLRHTGRDRGDLVIRLVRLDQEPAAPQMPIPVPEAMDGCDPVMGALRDEPGFLDVSAEVRPRALRIAQAISDECARRGYGFGLRADGQPSFEIVVGDDRFLFTLSEEFEQREIVDSDKLATAKYSWQRIPSSVQPVRSGRLLLRLGSGYGTSSWADRTRWTLDQKLHQVFKEVAYRAGARAAARRAKEEEQRRRYRQWEEAVPLARQAYIDQLNRNRLKKQAARSAEAEAIRAYCIRLDHLAEQCQDDTVAHRVGEWATWARQEADRIDPVGSPDQLAYVTPAKVDPADMDEFMPEGLTAWWPPD